MNQQAWSLVESDPQRAKEIVAQILEQASLLNYAEGRAFALNTCGVLAQNDGQYDKAERDFEEALRIRRQIGDQSLIASTLHNLGGVKENKGEYVQAIDLVTESIWMWESLGEDIKLGIAYNTLAGIYEGNNNTEDAIRYTKESLRKLKGTKEWEAIADTEYNLGRRYYYLFGNNELAKAHYQNALQLLERKVDNKYTYCSTLNALGVIEMESGAFDPAEQYFNQALEQAQLVDDVLGAFDAYCNLSLLYETKENFKKALDFMKAAEQVLGDRGGDEDRQYLYAQYATIYKKQKNYKNALKYQVLSDSLEDARLNQEMSDQMARKETAFNLALAENEKETHRLRAERARFGRNVFIVLTSLLGLAVLFGGLWFRQRRKNVVIKHQQEIDELIEDQERQFMDAYFEGQEEEKKKYADQLHTHFGGLLVAAKWNYDSLLDEMKAQDSEWVSKLKVANGNLQNIYEEVRDKSHQFGTKRLEKVGLIAALNNLCKTISTNGRIDASFNSFGLDERLDAKTEIAVYRIVQELVTNVLKHAKAKNLTVQVNPVDKVLSVMVEDDGEGFDLDKAMDEGMGLTDIIARAESLGGSANFDSNKGAGTTVIVDIPFGNQAD